MKTILDIFMASNCHVKISRWHHQMEAFSALLALCEGNSPVTSEFPSQSPVTRRYSLRKISKNYWSCQVLTYLFIFIGKVEHHDVYTWKTKHSKIVFSDKLKYVLLYGGK